MEPNPHIFIVGGNGAVGNAAAKFFLNAQFKVTVLVRDSKKVVELEEAGTKVITGNITNPVDVRTIFIGADVVLTAVHGLLGRGKNKSGNVDDTGHRRLIDEAASCGVKHFIYPSIVNVSQNHPVDFYRTKFQVEQYLKKSGINYTILRLPAFMEWHVYNLLGKSIVERGKVTILGKGNNPLSFIAIRDVVSAMGIMVLNETFYNQTVVLGGPENLTRNEVAERFEKALNLKPEIIHIPPTILKFFSVVLQPLHPGFAGLMKYSLYTDTSNEKLDKKFTVERFGLKPVLPDDFIKEITGKQSVEHDLTKDASKIEVV